jgi:hypothetical protein
MVDGICPNCGRDIYDHDASERKVCHDAVSGYRRPLSENPDIAGILIDDSLASNPILSEIPEIATNPIEGEYRFLRPDPDDPSYYAGREFGLPDPWD